jgi:nucleoside triphosphate pyrophosphatase
MLVLASASPRRRELLQNAGIAFMVQPADVAEVPLPGESPQAYAKRLATEKAAAVGRRQPDDWILGSDTIVIVDGLILEKPADKDDAARMLRLLSGRSHEVITAVCLLNRGCSVCDVRLEATKVIVGEISEAEIRDYVATGEPMDKAGAYAIQGRASRWISRIEGDYFNVVGLPVSLVYRMLQEQKLV